MEFNPFDFVFPSTWFLFFFLSLLQTPSKSKHSPHLIESSEGMCRKEQRNDRYKQYFYKVDRETDRQSTFITFSQLWAFSFFHFAWISLSLSLSPLVILIVLCPSFFFLCMWKISCHFIMVFWAIVLMTPNNRSLYQSFIFIFINFPLPPQYNMM